MTEYGNQMVQINRNNAANRPNTVKRSANGFGCKFLRSIYITLLFAINLALFIYSVNGRLFEGGAFNEAYLAVVGGIFVISFVLILALSFSADAQNALCGVMTMLVIVMFYWQFALFNTDTFIEEWLKEKASWLTFIGIVPASWLTGLFFGVIVFFVFRHTMPLVLLTSTVLLSGTLYIASMEIKPLPDNEYVVLKKYQDRGKATADGKLVYFFVPKLPSYQFFNMIGEPDFRDLRDMLIGFYAVNNFEIYPNAFVQKNDTVSNLIDIHNQVDYLSTSSGDRKYAQIINSWNFEHSMLELFALEDSLLYAELKKNGYAVSTYPMPGFNLCYKKEEIYSDRCTIKNNKVVDLYDKKSSLDKNVFALLGEWVLSLNIRDLKSVAKMLLDMSNEKGYKILSENRRITAEGAPYLFKEMNKDYQSDKGGMAYMAYVDMPSDVYIYDEFCRLKPRKQWVALKDNSVWSGGIDEKRRAYAEQTKCMLGLMQLWLDEAAESGKLSETDVIVQGVSTLRELAGMPAGQYGTFVADKLVSLGIRRKDSTQFSLNANICLASDFTKTFIRQEPFCYTIDNMKMSREDAYNLKQELISNSLLRGNKVAALAVNYNDWYEEFKANSPFAKQGKASDAKPKAVPLPAPQAQRKPVAAVPVTPEPMAVEKPVVVETVEEENKTVEEAPVAEEVSVPDVSVNPSQEVKADNLSEVAAEALEEIIELGEVPAEEVLDAEVSSEVETPAELKANDVSASSLDTTEPVVPVVQDFQPLADDEADIDISE